MPDPTDPTRRVTLQLSKPLGWFPKPTVVIAGRGQPAQWGEGTWQVPAVEETELRVFLFNRVWRYGEAIVVVGPQTSDRLVYRAPLLPFLRGRLTAL